MLRRLSVSLLVLAVIAPAALAGSSPIGRKITDFTLPDYHGREHSLSDFADAKVVVVAFMGTECPLAKLYGPKLAKLAKQYRDRGVAFIGVNSNAQDGIVVIAAFARIHQIPFPILKDLRHEVADQFGAERTPEVFVLDRQRRIRYRGRIDDQYGIGYARDEAKHEYLVDAIEAVLAGKPVAVAETPAEGCIIGRTRKPDPKSDVTYSRQISRLLNRHCVECHRPGEIAPFSLTSYSKASGWAEMIAEVIADGRMPPWHADPKHGQFANERRLTEEEKQLVYRWVDAGAPEGDPAELPPPPRFTTGWQLPRQPDLVVPMSDQPFNVPAEGAVRYQYFLADPGFTEEKWIQAVEVQPGNRAVVHHILVFAMPPDVRNLAALGGGVNGFLAAYVPGLRAEPFPKGMAKRIPAGSKLIFQVHYTPNGSPQKDLSRVGFIFADPDQIEYEVVTTSAAQRFLRIPPHADNHRVDASRILRSDSLFLGMMPHMHLRGKAFRYEAIARDGTKEILLDIPQYDFNWQTNYRLARPKKLPRGTRIHCIAYYDNSEDNWNNPDPNRTVRWGDQTWDEMMIGYFDIAVPKEEMDQELSAEVKIPEQGVVIPIRYRKFFRRYDKAGDARLSEEEIDALPPLIKARVLQYVRDRQRNRTDK